MESVLSAYGWDAGFEEKFGGFREQGLLPARVVESSRQVYRLRTVDGEVYGKLSGKFRYDCRSLGDYPTVGDWVAYKPGEVKGYVSVRGLVERKSRFSRKVAGKVTEEQVIAANIDTVFIVSGLDRDYNLRRLERYVTLAAESRAGIVFILNKADLCKELEEMIAEVNGLFPDAPVYAVSALEGRGLQRLEPHLKPGKTVVFLGSSGAGKSTIINRLLGTERQRTGHVSAHDGKGRHITTSKSLIVLPGGAIVIDTPGLRELQLLCTGEGLKDAFSDIIALAGECRYRTCTHTNEPGCAVLAAVDEGRISAKRLENFHKLKKEIDHNIAKKDERFRNKRSAFWKDISKKAREIKKSRERDYDK